MKAAPKIATTVLVGLMLAGLAGCSPAQQTIFDSAMKIQSATSMQFHTTMSFNLTGTGLPASSQSELNKVSSLVNTAKLSIDTKTTSNSDKSISKTSMDINLASPGLNMDVPIWIDSDTTTTPLRLNEIIKLPAIVQSSMPQALQGKDYLVVSQSDIASTGISAADISNIAQVSATLHTAGIKFLASYSQRFNPPFTVVDNGISNVTTTSGTVPAHIYTVNLTNSQLNDLIRYTVINFANDTEAMSFLHDTISSVLTAQQASGQTVDIAALDTAFATINANKPDFLAKLSQLMDSFQSVQIVGDKGITINYALYNGNIVNENGTIDLKLDLAQLASLANSRSNTTTPAQGSFELLTNFSTDISNINGAVDVSIPDTSSSNSFSLADLSPQNNIQATVASSTDDISSPSDDTSSSSDNTLSPSDDSSDQ